MVTNVFGLLISQSRLSPPSKVPQPPGQFRHFTQHSLQNKYQKNIFFHTKIYHKEKHTHRYIRFYIFRFFLFPFPPKSLLRFFSCYSSFVWSNFSSMASENFSDKNLIFRKLKAKSDNKVLSWNPSLYFVFFVYPFGENLNFDCFLLLWSIGFRSTIWVFLFIYFWFCFDFFFRCALIVMQRIRIGRLWLMGFFSASIVPLFIAVLVFTEVLWGKFFFIDILWFF